MTILDYLDKLMNVHQHSTWLQAKCPVCDGKLKISLNSYNYGSYACYSNSCHDKHGRNLIREVIFRKTPFRKSGIFAYKHPKNKIIKYEVIRNRPWTLTTLEQYKTDEAYIAPKLLNNTVIYTYSDTFKVIRIAMDDGSKLFSFRNKVDNVWEKGYTTYPTVYAEKYIQSHVFVVEGEKCADVLHKLGYAAISLPAAFRKHGAIEVVLKYLASRGVKSCLYLRDNDDVGLRDAKTFMHTAWKNNIDCKIENPAEFYNTDACGFDIADVDSDTIDSYLSHLFKLPYVTHTSRGQPTS